MVLCTVEGISLTRNGEPIRAGDTVNVGDVVGVTVSTDPANENVVVAVGRSPKAGCIQCNLTCDPPSTHFTRNSGFGGHEITFQVNDQWLSEAESRNPSDPNILISTSCIGTFDGDQFCNEDSVRIRIGKPEPGFTIEDLQVPAQTSATSATTISATLGNTGEGEGTGDLAVSSNGTTIGSRSVTLEPGQTKTLNFTCIP